LHYFLLWIFLWLILIMMKKLFLTLPKNYITQNIRRVCHMLFGIVYASWYSQQFTTNEMFIFILHTHTLTIHETSSFNFCYFKYKIWGRISNNKQLSTTFNNVVEKKAIPCDWILLCCFYSHEEKWENCKLFDLRS
jgi:hypothetical protein